MAKIPAPKTPGVVKGLGVTLKTMTKTMFPSRGIKTLIPAPSKGAATPANTTMSASAERTTLRLVTTTRAAATITAAMT